MGRPDPDPEGTLTPEREKARRDHLGGWWTWTELYAGWRRAFIRTQRLRLLAVRDADWWAGVRLVGSLQVQDRYHRAIQRREG